jgi:predicted nucleotidyltransferase
MEKGARAMSRAKKLAIPREQLAEFCRRHHIHKLSLFGSVLREDFRPDSDVDVLVVFEPGHALGWDIIDLEEELSRILGGHQIDLVKEKYLNHRLRDRVLAEAEVQYDAEG